MLKKNVYVKVLSNNIENRALYSKVENTGKLLGCSRLKNIPHEEFLESVKKFKKEAIDLMVKDMISDKDFYILTKIDHSVRGETNDVGFLKNVNDICNSQFEYTIKLLSLDKKPSEEYELIIDSIEITNYGLIYVNILNNISLSNIVSKSLVMVNEDESICYSTPIEVAHIGEDDIQVLKITVESTQEFIPLIPFLKKIKIKKSK